MRTHPNLFIGLILLALVFVSCSKDDKDDPIPEASFKGDFVSAVHPTSGVASVNPEETTLSLTNFSSDSGPDLNIYLATSLANVVNDFIDLGDIKGIDGNYTYALPDNVDYTAYKFVVVWCVAFDVNFGYAELVEQ